MSPSFLLNGCTILAFLVAFSIGQYDEFGLNPVASSDTICPDFPNPFLQCYHRGQLFEIQSRRAQQHGGKYMHLLILLIRNLFNY
jgi:hypothetical protein